MSRGYGGGGGGGAATPTGTGIPHIVGGVQNAAASLIVNADVNAAAAIAGSKISPDFGAQNVLTTGYVSLGATPATAGTGIRIGNAVTVVGRNAANSANFTVLQLDASNRVAVGDVAGAVAYLTLQQVSGDCAWVGTGEFTIQCGTSQQVTFKTGGTSRLRYDTASLQTALPIVGFSSVYGVHGSVTHTFASDANYTVTAAQYIYGTIEFATGVITAGRTVTLPHPATDSVGYEKLIVNSTNQTLTISTGTGTTRTLATNLGRRFRFTSAGVTHSGNTFTP